MREKIYNLISIFLPITAGIFLLFLGSVSSGVTAKISMARLPLAGSRGNLGGDLAPSVLPPSQPVVPLPKDGSAFAGDLSAVSALVLDDETDTVLFSKNEKESRPLASITKLMSALVLLDLPTRWSSSTVILSEDCDSSSHHINSGEEFALDDLFNIGLVGSSNSAITALVRESGISTENFARLMTRKAAALNIPTLHFVEPTGLDAGNVGSAEGVAKLLKEALKKERVFKALHTAEYYAHPLNKEKSRRVWSTDWLLTNWVPNFFSKSDIAGKTGYIVDSGYNFAVRLSGENRHPIIVVILGSETNESRFSEARDLAIWTFGHYLWPDEKGYNQLAD